MRTVGRQEDVTEGLGDAVDPNEGTGRAMVAFLDMAIRKNDIVEATGSALRTGVRKVLETDEALETQRIADYDIDDVMHRFHIKNRASMKDVSMRHYEQRFRSVVDMYAKWLAGDNDWRPRARTAPGSAKRRTATSDGVLPTTAGKTADEDADRTSQESVPDPGMVTYPYPVRPGILAQLKLPEDLTSREAERIARFVASLAFEERLALTAGPSIES